MGKLMVCTAVLTFAAAAGAMAQQTVIGKIEVNVVNVDVTVSSHGQPVRGLTGDDFEIFEDGVAQPLSNFYPVERAPATISAKSDSVSPPQASEAANVVDERFRRKVLVVIDNVHTTTINRNRALEKLERFINDHFTAGEYDWSIAVAGQRLLVVLPLTSDKQSIHDALAMIRSQRTWKRFENATIARENAARAIVQSSALSPDAPLSSHGGRDMDRATAFTTSADALESSMFATDTFLAVRDATRAFANTSGKKIVLLLSGGFGVDEVGIESLSGNSFGDLRNLASQRSRQTASLRDLLIREANASNVNFYVINPEGLGEADNMGHGPAAGSSSANGTLFWLASETGGRFMPGNRPELSLKQFDEASSNYYSLGYRPTHGQDARYHRIKVRLKNSHGYQLQYRDGYTSLSMDVQLVRLLLTPFSTNLQQPSALGFSVTAGDPRRSGSTTTIPLTARIPVKNLQFIPAVSGFDAQVDVYVSIFDSKGRNVSLQRYTTRAHATDGAGQQVGDLIHNATVKVKSGQPYTVVMAVRDSLTDAFAMNSQTLQF